MGLSKPWGALSQNPDTCHKEPGKGAVKKGRRGPLGLPPGSNPSTGGHCPVWRRPGASAHVRGYFCPLSSSPISVLSSMASTRCWASVVTDRLTVWSLSASVEIRPRDGDKGCWEGDGAGNASTRAFPKDGRAWSPLPTFYEIRAFDPRPLDSQEQGRDFEPLTLSPEQQLPYHLET